MLYAMIASTVAPTNARSTIVRLRFLRPEFGELLAISGKILSGISTPSSEQTNLSLI
jgi:hypothetical protein